MILKNLDLLDKETAWLICGVIASVLMFLLPQPGQRRNPKDLLLYLILVFATYAIFFKMHPWLAVQVGAPLAAIVAILLILALAGAFIRLAPRHLNSKTNTAL